MVLSLAEAVKCCNTFFWCVLISIQVRQQKNMEKQKIKDYDDFVGEIGEFGLWQKIICLILWVPAMAGGINVLMYSFTGLEPDQYR